MRKRGPLALLHWRPKRSLSRIGHQYVMRVPLATAHEKGYDGGSTTARRRPSDSRATSLPTGGPGCSEAPPSVAPHRGSTQERCCMKRASRAGSSLLEVSDGRALSSLLWPRRAQKNRGRLLYSQYQGAKARERDPDLSDDDHRPVGLGRLAPGARVLPCGHGKHRRLYASRNLAKKML